MEYEIDLNAANASTFRSHMAPFVGNARRAISGSRPGLARPASSRKRGADIRAWAKERGIEVGDRGRIPAAVIERYRAAKAR